MDSKNKKGFLESTSSAEEMNAPKLDSAHVEDFKTPDQIAAQEADETGAVIGHHDTPPLAASASITPKDGRPLKEKVLAYYRENKRVCLVGLAVTLVVLSGTSYAFLKPHKKVVSVAPVKIAKKVVPKVTTVPSALTGLPVEPAINTRPITGIMIENSTDARPQAGLSQAGVVFEAIAEGGITRFLTLFQDSTPDNIGPVRSARPYYLEWALGFDAAYAHVGGSPEALSDIRTWGVRDLDQFFNSGAYHRISERAAPHNVYTSFATLNQLETAKGYTSSAFTSFPRKAEKALKVPIAKSVDMGISGPTYNVHYDYNATTNSYNRSEGGAPHIDANTNAQISPKVAIGIVVPYSIQSDGKHSNYGVIGSGQAYIFQDGGVTIGNWSKADDKSQITFTDSAGVAIPLDPGQTWITTVKTAGNVTYAP